MTLKEFFKRARRVKWVVTRLNGIDIIRTKSRFPAVGYSNCKTQQLCPLAYVLKTWSATDAADRSNLTHEQAYSIMLRADGDEGWRGRYRLKRALGIAK